MAAEIGISELPGLPTRDEMRIMRIQARKRLTRLGIIQLVIACIALVIGISQIAMANPDYTWPFINPMTLITGILVGISGVLGFMAGKSKDIDGEVAAREKCMVIAHYALSISSISVAVNTAVFSTFVVASCSGPGFYACDYNIKGRTIVSLIAMIIGITIAICSIVSAAFFCTGTSRHGYGFRSRRERCMEVAMIRQQRVHQNQIEQLQRQYGPQFGVEPPPTYEEAVVKKNNAIR